MTKIQEIANKYGVTNMYIGRVKSRMFGKNAELSENEWLELESAIAESQGNSDPDDIDDDPVFEIVRFRVMGASPNHRNFVKGKECDNPQKMVWMSIPYGTDPMSLVGQYRKAEKISYKGKTFYRDAWFAGKMFDPRYCRGD